MASAQSEIDEARKPPSLKLVTSRARSRSRSVVEVPNAQRSGSKAAKADNDPSQAVKLSLVVQNRSRKKSRTPGPSIDANKIQQPESHIEKPTVQTPKLVLRIPLKRTPKRNLETMGRLLADSVYDNWPKHQEGRHKHMPDCIGFWEWNEQQDTSHKQIEETKADLRDFQTRIPLLEDLLDGDFMIERRNKRRRRRRSVVQLPEEQ